jgi:hypothetical protein
MELAAIFYCLRLETSLFVASYYSQGYVELFDPASTWSYHIEHMDYPLTGCQSQSYVTTDGKAPIWSLRPDLYYCWTVAGLLRWGAVSDERTGLSFARLSQQY